MVIFKKVADIQAFLAQKKAENKVIGYVPTMGALHDGHISLVQQNKRDGTLSVCSIFLNPTQFNDKTDLEKYPVSIESDIELLLTADCDVLFLPSVDEVYPGGEQNFPIYDFGALEEVLEGASRPGHFKGVGQVVARLLDIVKPDVVYLGRKDYQQCLIIRKLTELIGMKDTEVVICPTRREEDGLAMSSRNRRLSTPQRAVAGTIYQCLVSIQSKKDTAPFAIVRKECEDILRAKGFEPEYIALADAADLTVLEEYTPDADMVALIAANNGGIRLIDNILL